MRTNSARVGTAAKMAGHDLVLDLGRPLDLALEGLHLLAGVGDLLIVRLDLEVVGSLRLEEFLAMLFIEAKIFLDEYLLANFFGQIVPVRRCLLGMGHDADQGHLVEKRPGAEPFDRLERLVRMAESHLPFDHPLERPAEFHVTVGTISSRPGVQGPPLLGQFEGLLQVGNRLVTPAQLPEDDGTMMVSRRSDVPG